MAKSLAAEFKSSAGIAMIRAPAGAFTMGSPESEDGHRVWERQGEVAFTSDFYLGKTPVMQGQYEAVIGANPTDHEKIGEAPVDSVTWEQASEYCRKLTALDRDAGVLPSDWEYRLPTEAEWEYACRAGSSAPAFGHVADVAWFCDNAGDKPHAVSEKAPNAWGFHDMLGNVWEWRQDWFCVANPRRSVRGGSYFNSARFCRAAQRWGWNPNGRGRYCGFRVLAARSGAFELTPPIDDFPTQEQPPSIFDAIDANDFDLALQIIAADPSAIESVDGIPPPLHDCVYRDNLEWLEWLLDHGANIERREQDYGATPLTTAVVMRQQHIIPILIARGANTAGALRRAQNGLAGLYENSGLDREGYREVLELLRKLGARE